MKLSQMCGARGPTLLATLLVRAPPPRRLRLAAPSFRSNRGAATASPSLPERAAHPEATTGPPPAGVEDKPEQDSPPDVIIPPFKPVIPPIIRSLSFPPPLTPALDPGPPLPPKRAVTVPPFSARLYEALRLSEFTHNEFSRAFDTLDENRDGKVSSAEAQTLLGTRLGLEFVSKFSENGTLEITRERFIERITKLSDVVDSRVWPIAVSMLFTGAAVGLVVPVLPLLVQDYLSGTPAEFGLVIGAFGLAKMICNVPAAVAADALGRKPLLTGGMGLVTLGSVGVALASTMDHLIAARLLTGVGVAAFTTGSTLYLADLSTPLNRARTMAPILSAFSAGAAVGPAMGGVMADQLGIAPCFWLTGAGFACLTLYNHRALDETFPIRLRSDSSRMANTVIEAIKSWGPITRKVAGLKSVLVVNSLYWIAISGSQMTLLPLMLVQHGYTASEVGMIFAAMSAFFVFGSQPAGYLADKLGKPLVITVSLSTMSLAMMAFAVSSSASMTAAVGEAIAAALQLDHDGAVATMAKALPWQHVSLGLWAIGGTLLGTAPTAHVADLVGTKDRSQALALLRTVGDLGLLIGASTTGVLADKTSMEAAVLMNGGLVGAIGLTYGLSELYSARRRAQSAAR